MSLVRMKRRLEGVSYEGQRYENLDLRSSKAAGSSWKECHFIGCQIDLSDFRNARFEDCQFTKCSFRLSNFFSSSFEKVTFYECDMEQASLMGAVLRIVTFADCRMAYGELLFQDATVRDSVIFRGCNLHGSNLDFREVPRNALFFQNSNLWSCKMSMGCQFWNAVFDEKLVKQFLAMMARTTEDGRLVVLAGDQYTVVIRAMDGGQKWDQASTTSPATGSNQIQNSAVPMATTAIAVTPTLAVTVSPMMIDGV